MLIVGGILRGRGLPSRALQKLLAEWSAAPRRISLFSKGFIEGRKAKDRNRQRYSLDEIAEAHRYAEAGHKKGHMVIVLEQKDERG